MIFLSDAVLIILNAKWVFLLLWLVIPNAEGQAQAC